MTEVSWWQARALAGEAMGSSSSEVVPLVDALGRTLASDAAAPTDLPGFPTAAMDGWVVCGSGPWTVVGTIDTGSSSVVHLDAGEAMRIGTGGAVPAGATAVIPFEEATVTHSQVNADVTDRTHIRVQGEECVVGDVLAHRGDVVNPALMGSLSAAGIDDVAVVQRPLISVLILGDEVIHSGVPTTGQVRDALGVQLPGWIHILGGDVVSVRTCTDDPQELADALRSSSGEADMTVVTGGTARGHRDFLRSTLEDLDATMIVDGVAVRPGHPMMFATLDGTPVVGLPGNPLSALVATVTLIQPSFEAWFGRAQRDLPKVAMAEGVAPSSRPLTRLMVGRRELGGFRQVERVSSAMLRGIAHADGWAVVPQQGVDADEAVPWIPVPWMRRTDDR